MQKGHCLCGNVQYEFDETQVGFGLHCHCIDCQRVTGSGKATVICFLKARLPLKANTKPSVLWQRGLSRESRILPELR